MKLVKLETPSNLYKVSTGGAPETLVSAKDELGAAKKYLEHFFPTRQLSNDFYRCTYNSKKALCVATKPLEGHRYYLYVVSLDDDQIEFLE